MKAIALAPISGKLAGVSPDELYITAAYWFTSSTSFANPAITIARSLSDSFAGIAPACVPGFVAAQVLGALAAHFAADLLFTEKPKAIA